MSIQIEKIFLIYFYRHHLQMSILSIYICIVMAKKMISIRFDEKLLEHLKNLKEVKAKNLTFFIERACKKESKFKEVA